MKHAKDGVAEIYAEVQIREQAQSAEGHSIGSIQVDQVCSIFCDVLKEKGIDIRKIFGEE